MKNISSIEFHIGSKEERLPNYAPDFPYIASRVELDQFIGRSVPWHWHKPVELFYVESGVLEYYTPKGKTIFPAGSGGMINSNVLHRTSAQSELDKNVQLLHIFDTSFIGGQQGSRIEQKYITPIIAAPQIEVIALSPDDLAQSQLLNTIRESFHLSVNELGYEIKLNSVLSDIWFQIFNIALPLLDKMGSYDKSNDKIKLMMIYIHEHYAEKISVTNIAAAAFCSERECFRIFHACLNMTPIEYVRSYRLQMACYMLAKGNESITFISQACGLGSSSYFGKTFREYIGCTPLEYRRKWQDNDINRQ
ncbi:AraC family transcriptional regulator [Bacillus ndiopicus]|uniref:AraC family transcriptional regulator n=1 Tax=Bacillus ndiopicus TaxID=1347368 RepID=UPI0005AA2034|nr:AraC family transcriptional regulator [Bacillus ndiopicus]